MKRLRVVIVIASIVAGPPLLASLGFGSLVRSGGKTLLLPFASALRFASAQTSKNKDPDSTERVEINRLTLEVAALRVKERQLDELSRLIGFELPSGNIIVPANVIGMSIDPEHRALFINRGVADGVTEGAAVMGGGHWLLGTVQAAQNHSATIRLLTDDGSTLSALVLPEGKSPLVVSGVFGTGTVLTLIPSDLTVTVGSTVITGGIEPDIPRGLIIGRVGAPVQTGRGAWGTAPLELAPELGQLPATVGVVRHERL